MADEEEASEAFKQACMDLAAKTSDLNAASVSYYLTQDEATGRAPAGFNPKNPHHRELVAWGVKAGIRGAITSVVTLGTIATAAEGSDD